MFPSLGPMEMMVVGLVAVMLFGRRLPEVGRSLGKGIVEFKKGIRGIEDDEPAHGHSSAKTDQLRPASDLITSPNVPKFEPPSAPPVAAVASEPGTQPFTD